MKPIASCAEHPGGRLGRLKGSQPLSPLIHSLNPDQVGPQLLEPAPPANVSSMTDHLSDGFMAGELVVIRFSSRGIPKGMGAFHEKNKCADC